MANDGYGPKYQTGKKCIEKGCEQPAGTAWGPHWRKDCDIKRKDRIAKSLEKLAKGVTD